MDANVPPESIIKAIIRDTQCGGSRARELCAPDDAPGVSDNLFDNRLGALW